MENFRKTHVCDNHFISHGGIVKSVDRMVKNKNGYRVAKGSIKKQHISSNGYKMVSIDRKIGNVTVHSLVARAFVDGYSEGLCVNHKDGNKLNNNSLNLEWVTYSENAIHAVRNGMVDSNYSRVKGSVGEDHGMSKLTESEVIKIFNAVANGAKQIDIAEKYGVAQAQIWNIANRKTWKSVTAKLKVKKYNKNGRFFSDEELIRVRELRENLISFSKIAKIYGCSKKTVMNSVKYD